jgi:hypothetical protein
VFAVVCCAGVPLLASLVGGLTIAGLLGVSAGVLIVAATVAVAVLVVRSGRRGAGPWRGASAARERRKP